MTEATTQDLLAMIAGLTQTVSVLVQERKPRKAPEKTAFTASDETPEFKEFWTLWMPSARKCDGRGDARDGFMRKIKAGVDGKDILDGARYYLRNMTEDDRKFNPLAKSWINKMAYEDLCIRERQYQQRVSEAMARRQQETNVVQIDPAKRAEMAERARVLLKVGVGA